MAIEACGATHKGNVRNHNEDNIYVDGFFRSDLARDNVIIRNKRTEGQRVFAVFDGLGGAACGERASFIAALGLKTMEERGAADDIEMFVSTAHHAILQESIRKDARNMGTTAVVLLINDMRADIYNIGDSRAYLFRNRKLSQLSRDHSVWQSLMDHGFEEAARRDKRGGELTQYIGMFSEEDIEPEAFRASEILRPGDRLILCSDGLSNELSDEEIAGIIDEHRDDSAEHLTAWLIKAAVDKRGRDNVSVVVVKVD
ncbi:MAG: serine/threonine-protein phosphatase [Clostridiales bacterium]|nr:serine/threonine-protein phosphatase [Clostridiales bacterium]MBR0468766.1 serine/threonine-protein phosphatase [Mogibacterium sp.]